MLDACDMLLAAIPKPMISSEQLAIVAVVVAVTTIFILNTRRKLRNLGNDPRTYVKELRSRVQEEKAAAGDVGQVMRELDDLARQIHGRIDTRIAKVEAIIRDADRRIDALSRLVREARGLGVMDAVCGDPDPGATPPPRPRVEVREPHGEVCRLAEAGLTAQQISAELGRSVGEVELILSLQKTRQAVSAAAARSSSSSVS